MHKRALPIGLFLAAAILLAAAPIELVLKKQDHEKLGGLIQAYYKAKQEGEKISETFAKVAEWILKAEKAAKDKVQVLALVDDLQRALYQADELKGSAKKGKNEISFEQQGVGAIKYMLYAPSNYAPAKGPYGLVLVYPNEVGDKGKLTELLDRDWLLTMQSEKYLVAVIVPPADPKRWTELGEPSDPGGLALALYVLGNVRTTYLVDVDTVFVAGHGAGAAAAFRLAAFYPHRFAGALARAGDIQPTPAVNFRSVPTFVTGGANSTAFRAEVDALGYKNCAEKPAAGEQEALDWMADKRRDANPLHVTLAPVAHPGSRAYWLRAEGFEPGTAKVDAVIDREKNRIDVTAEGITSLQMFFNDALLDLGKPVEVSCNGKTHTDKFARNLQTFLDEAYRSNDPGRICTAFKIYDVPAVEKPK